MKGRSQAVRVKSHLLAERQVRSVALMLLLLYWNVVALILCCGDETMCCFGSYLCCCQYENEPKDYGPLEIRSWKLCSDYELIETMRTDMVQGYSLDKREV